MSVFHLVEVTYDEQGTIDHVDAVYEFEYSGDGDPFSALQRAVMAFLATEQGRQYWEERWRHLAWSQVLEKMPAAHLAQFGLRQTGCETHPRVVGSHETFRPPS